MDKTLVATATYNEINNIDKLITKINNLKIKTDILVIDDNSPDKTWLKLIKLKKKYKNLNYIIRKKKTGLDSAHKKIFSYAIKNKYRYLITMDADLSHDPMAIPIFIKKIKNYDCVIGSRYIRGGKNGLKGFRLLLSKYGNILIRIVLNISLNE
ncbi:glycosyltransferase, partial [Candidatus Pelagibacter sp.]|nr:glycosyltransferase [Candidatus Pelagibacter sp.]